MSDERFDGLFMSAIQQAQGINNFYDAMFSFMRRKTDFFSQDDSSFETVKNNFEKHRVLFKQDTKKQAAIKKIQDEEKAKLAAKQKEQQPVKKEEGATIEEIDEDEAKRIELESIFTKQQEAKKNPKKDKKVPGEEGEDEKEEENVKQKPNAGNGGETTKYVWHQTLGEVSAMIPLAAGTTAKMLDVKIGINDFKVSMKGKGGDPIVVGKWHKKIKEDESLWSIEKESDKVILNVTIEKFEGQNWWNCLLQGDIEIDTQKVEPENSKLSDLDGETRSTVEKMMFDQAAKAQGKPTSDETEKQDKLKQFMAAHPEMDFSKAKFC